MAPTTQPLSPPDRHRLKFAGQALAILLVVSLGFFSMIGSGGSSGSSGSSSVNALSMPDRIQLSNTEDSSSDAASAIGRSLAYHRAAYDGAGSDYSNQETQTWVEDTDALDMVNDILSAMNQTAYDEFVNAGAYKALVEPVGQSETSQGGNSSSSTTTESLQEFIVNVTRASNSDPMIVKVWLIEEEGPGDMAMLIRGYFEVSQGVSASYPFGVLEAHFRGDLLDANGALTDEVMNMAMQIGADDDGNVTIEMVEDFNEANSGFEELSRVRVLANADATEGNAYTYCKEVHPVDGTTEFTAYFAFDEDYFKFTEDGGNTETVLDKNDFNYQVYRYNLFNKADGSHVDRTSGYPIQMVGGDQDGRHAYIGYWGLWAPPGLNIQDGDTVTIMDNNSDAQYTVVKKNGKLKKHTATQIDLVDLADMEMSYWETDTDYIITWDDGNEVFKKIGQRDPNSGNITYYDPGAQTDIIAMDEYEGAWCEALNAFLPLGSLFQDGNTPNNNSVLAYHEEENINPATASNMTLYYWGYALDAPISQTDIDTADESAYWNNPAETTFFFDAAELLLKEDDVSGAAYLFSDNLDLSGSRYEYGMNLSPLTTAQYAEANSWQAYSANTYYSWQTGQDDWNQFTTLKDAADDFVVFDPPLVLQYAHSSDNDLNGEAAYDGKTFRLDYDGSELHIPWEFNPNADSGHEWEPMFNLKNGTTVTDASSNEYVVKAIERALIMQEAADPTLADGLTLDTTVAAPTLTYDASKTGLLGSMPEDVTLKVNKGEVL